MAIGATNEILRLDVRVNPQNGDWTQNNPEYRRSQIEDADHIKADLVELMKKELEEGALEIEVDPNNPLIANEEAAILFRAHRATQKAMTLRGALGGYGLVGKIDSIGFHGVADIHWTPDDKVPVGDFRLDGSVEDRAAIIERLMRAIP